MPYFDYDDDGRCQGCGAEMSKDVPSDADQRTAREKTVACSSRCHKRVQRERAGYRKPFKPCRFCGDLRNDYQGRDVRCPEEDRSDHCDELQYLADARAGYVAERRDERTVDCLAPGCTRKVTWSGKGRVATTCSSRCRQRVRRARLRGEDI
ncbi:hypothetical protein ACWEOP_26165 [Streptomyces chartreusis]